jgi:hypothetical protein
MPPRHFRLNVAPVRHVTGQRVQLFRADSDPAAFRVETMAGGVKRHAPVFIVRHTRLRLDRAHGLLHVICTLGTDSPYPSRRTDTEPRAMVLVELRVGVAIRCEQ